MKKIQTNIKYAKNLIGLTNNIELLQNKLIIL